MNKSVIRSITYMLLGIALMSCSKDFSTEQVAKIEEFNTNFQNLVMGDLQINPNQTWNTSVSTTVNVSVDLDYGAEYKVFIYGSAPLINKDLAWLGKATLKSGESKTLTIAKSASTVGLYAALYDKNNHAIVMPMTLDGNTYSVAFGNKSEAAMTRGTSSGYRWSVETAQMPNFSSYGTGATVLVDGDLPDGNNNTRPANTVTKYIIPKGSSYDVIVPKLAAGKDDDETVVSMYVAGEWIISGDQRVNMNNKVIVAPGGKITISSGGNLTTNDDNLGNAGMVHVMAGGQITGDGELVLANGTKEYAFNAGTIDVATLNNNGGVLYNIGTIGTEDRPVEYLCGAGATEQPGRFINHGHAVFSNVRGQGLSFENACSMKVIGELYIGMSSKMDNGSFVECGTLDLHGDNSSYNKLLYMGENSYMKVKEDINILNFGVWGPNSPSGTINRAYFSIPNSVEGKYPGTPVNFNTGETTTFMLDNVELIIPDDFDAQILNGGYACNSQGQLLYGYYNGLNYTTVNPAASDPNAWMWDGYNYRSRQTCHYGVASSYNITPNEDDCGVTAETTPNEEEEEEQEENCNWVYYAFEDLGGTKDFDFNDVVLRVSPEGEVQILATGGDLSSQVIIYRSSGSNTDPNGNAYDDFGSEVHEALGTSPNSITNTGANVDKSSFKVLGYVSIPGDASDPGSIPFGLKVMNRDGEIRSIVTSRITGTDNNSQDTTNAAPLYIVVNGDGNGKWYWPRELVNIGTTFSGFADWGANMSSGDWYTPANATPGTFTYW